MDIVLWSYLCVVVASQSLYLDKKWRKKGSFSMNLLSKISAKAKNNLCSYRELNPGLPRERLTIKPVDQRSYMYNIYWIEQQIKIDFKIMKTLCTVQEFGTFYIQFPFFFKISQCTNTANILLCNKIHLKWTHKVFFHVPWQKNIKWFPRSCKNLKILLKIVDHNLKIRSEDFSENLSISLPFFTVHFLRVLLVWTQ